MTHEEFWHRSHNLGELNKSHVGSTVTLMGWVNRRRDLGHLIFLDLRDRYGMTHVVLDPARVSSVHEIGAELRHEYVIAIRGKVSARPDGMVNAGMATGEVEILADDLRILNRSEPLPFPIQDESEATETLRLKYRYLDLRRPTLKNNILNRIKFVKEMRRALEDLNFLDIETPFLLIKLYFREIYLL